ncbi:MAG: DUF3426 domain-containing protein [bacterium]
MSDLGPEDTIPPGYIPNQYTRCPYCMAVFRVNQEKISARGGDVRCGACREVFNALQHAVEIDEDGGFRRLSTDHDSSSAHISDDSVAVESDDLKVTHDEPLGLNSSISQAPDSDDLPTTAEQIEEISVDEPATKTLDAVSEIDDQSENTALSQSIIDQPSTERIESPENNAAYNDIKTESNLTSETVDSTPDNPENLSGHAEDAESATETNPDSDLQALSDAVPAVDNQVDYQQTASPLDYDSTSSIDVISAYAQDPEWDKEWLEFSEQHVESAVLDTYMEHRSGSVHANNSEVNQVANAESEVRNWFNAEPDSLLDNNPFPSESGADTTKPNEDPRPSLINMSGVDQFIMDRPNPLASILWFFISAAFVILLGLQVKYFFVERFAQDERYRSYLSFFCKIAQCDLPPRRDAYRFTITNTRIDLHPDEPGALRITVKLLNQADFEQPYPELQLTLTDRVGRVVGRRTFEPEFYLSAGQHPQLAPGELGAVSFDLARPHEKAVGFVVDVVPRPATS